MIQILQEHFWACWWLIVIGFIALCNMGPIVIVKKTKRERSE